MTPKTCVSGPEPHRVEILLARGFVPTELAAAFDCFRIANRLAGQDLFEMSIVSVDGTTSLPSLGGIEVATRATAPDLPDLLIVTGGAGMVRAQSIFLPRLQKVRHAGGVALVLSDAAQALLTAGATDSAAVHWEGRPVLEEAGLADRGRNALYTRSGTLLTSAGMAATSDTVLALIAGIASPLLAKEVGRVLLLDRVRQADTEQPLGLSALAGLPDGPLREALVVMEATLEFPVPTSEIARRVGLSTRQLERIFARHLRHSPQAYYRNLRLFRARTLIESSSLPLTEIALSCGFETQSHFARVFKSRYGATPYTIRQQGLRGPGERRSEAT
jgi:AraC family transcriptional regulator, glycine betaine-responsive activator